MKTAPEVAGCDDLIGVRRFAKESARKPTETSLFALASGTLKLSGRPTLTRAQHKDGSRLYIEMSFALVKDADGSPVGSVAVARAAAPPRTTERQ